MKPVRLARLLAERMEAEGERAGGAVTVGELLERYVPYEVARGSLELTTKAEYDLLVLEFLADRRLTVLRDPAVGEAAAEELDTPEPDLGPLEEHAGAALRLDLATISGGYSASGPGEGDGAAAAEGAAWDPTGGVEARPAPEAPEPPEDEADVAAAGDGPSAGERDVPGGRGGPGPDDGCPGCGRPFPRDVDVPVRFCPHCGTARPDRSCPECGERLQPHWSYCPACGAGA